MSANDANATNYLGGETMERLNELIKQARQGVIMTGQALREINEEKLYKQTHSSFEAFIGDTFDKSRAWAYNMINDSVKLAKAQEIAPVANIAQAKALLSVSPALRPAVVQFINTTPDRLTARSIHEVAEAIQHAVTTKTFDLGEDGQVPVGILQASEIHITQEAEERYKRQKQYIHENSGGLSNEEKVARLLVEISRLLGSEVRLEIVKSVKNLDTQRMSKVSKIPLDWRAVDEFAHIRARALNTWFNNINKKITHFVTEVPKCVAPVAESKAPKAKGKTPKDLILAVQKTIFPNGDFGRAGGIAKVLWGHFGCQMTVDDLVTYVYEFPDWYRRNNDNINLPEGVKTYPSNFAEFIANCSKPEPMPAWLNLDSSNDPFALGSM